MVLGVVMMASMLPTMIGLNEATQGTRDQEENRKISARKQRCHLVATCSLSQGTESQRAQVQNARVYVGQDGKVSIVTHKKQSQRNKQKIMLTNCFVAALYHEKTQLRIVSLQWWLLHPPGFPPEQYIRCSDHYWRRDPHLAMGVLGCYHA